VIEHVLTDRTSVFPIALAIAPNDGGVPPEDETRRMTSTQTIQAEMAHLLGDVIERVRDGRSLTAVVRRPLSVARLRTLLAPIAADATHLDWIGVNGARVDVVVTSPRGEWRIVFGTADRHRLDWIDVFERPAPPADGTAIPAAVLVNGPSGAGKSMLMRALQAESSAPLVIFDEPEHVGAVQPGYLIWRECAPQLHRGYLAAIAALARCGNQVAVSAAGHPQAELASAFTDVPSLAVGVFCDRDVLVERERRTGRWGGIAEASLAVHDGWTYDVSIDTTSSPDLAPVAHRILAMLA
jgi:chloramphenicol 3-O-phosphotransferase